MGVDVNCAVDEKEINERKVTRKGSLFIMGKTRNIETEATEE